MIGRTVGNYVIQDRIGVGGMGVVYLAEHPRIGRRVAIKVLLPEYSKNQSVVARFFNEAKSANEIRHEHIIDVIDFGELPDDEGSYIIMEYLDGTSLEAALERTPRMPLPRAVHIARGIGRALGAAHARGIIHRDLKPDNVFLIHRESDPDFVKVLDFGIAKLTQQVSAPELKTQTGALIGTPTYMAPEQCRGLPVDGRTDQYALGVILYRMLTGRLPFDAENLGELLLQQMTKDPTPLREIDATIPPGVEATVLRALAKDPEARFHHIEELLSALVDVATGPYPVQAITTPMGASAGKPLTAPTVAAPRPSVAPTLAASKKAIDTLGAAAGQKQNVTLPPTRRGMTVAIAAVGAVLVLGAATAVMLKRANVNVNANANVNGNANVNANVQAAQPVAPPRPEPVAVTPPPIVAAPAPVPIAPAPTPAVAAPAPAKKHRVRAGEPQLPRPPSAGEPAPAKSEPPKAAAADPATRPAPKPDAKKPVYKGAKGNLITDFPAE